MELRVQSRWNVLLREYEMLREDERAWMTTMVAICSVLALVGGTSAFFLLRGCAVGRMDDKACLASDYAWQVYALLPAPTMAVCALLVQQATVATIRGRLMRAVEEALVTERRTTYKLGDGEVPAMASYHLQHDITHGPRGAALWTLMFTLPFIVVLGLIFYCGMAFAGPAQVIFYSIYCGVVALMGWAGYPALVGYGNIDRWLIQYVSKQRRSRHFRI